MVEVALKLKSMSIGIFISDFLFRKKIWMDPLDC